jgi:hypothetical protein
MANRDAVMSSFGSLEPKDKIQNHLRLLSPTTPKPNKTALKPYSEFYQVSGIKVGISRGLRSNNAVN